jgi:hypothetical protein
LPETCAEFAKNDQFVSFYLVYELVKNITDRPLTVRELAGSANRTGHVYMFRPMGESVSLQTLGDSSRDNGQFANCKNGSQTGYFMRTQKNEMYYEYAQPSSSTSCAFLQADI